MTRVGAALGLLILVAACDRQADGCAAPGAFKPRTVQSLTAAEKQSAAIMKSEALAAISARGPSDSGFQQTLDGMEREAWEENPLGTYVNNVNAVAELSGCLRSKA